MLKSNNCFRIKRNAFHFISLDQSSVRLYNFKVKNKNTKKCHKLKEERNKSKHDPFRCMRTDIFLFSSDEFLFCFVVRAVMSRWQILIEEITIFPLYLCVNEKWPKKGKKYKIFIVSLTGNFRTFKRKTTTEFLLFLAATLVHGLDGKLTRFRIDVTKTGKRGTEEKQRQKEMACRTTHSHINKIINKRGEKSARNKR